MITSLSVSNRGFTIMSVAEERWLSMEDICKHLGVSNDTVYKWIDRFKHGGIEALKEQKGRGSKAKLPQDQHNAFREAVLDLQNHRHGGRIKGLDVLELMQEKFGIKCSLDTVYRALAKVDLVWISTRSKHPKTDFIAQDAFKKTSEKK